MERKQFFGKVRGLEISDGGHPHIIVFQQVKASDLSVNVSCNASRVVIHSGLFSDCTFSIRNGAGVHFGTGTRFVSCQFDVDGARREPWLILASDLEDSSFSGSVFNLRLNGAFDGRVNTIRNLSFEACGALVGFRPLGGVPLAEIRFPSNHDYAVIWDAETNLPLIESTTLGMAPSDGSLTGSLTTLFNVLKEDLYKFGQRDLYVSSGVTHRYIAAAKLILAAVRL